MSLAFDALLKGFRTGFREQPVAGAIRVGTTLGIAAGLMLCLALALS